MIFTFYSYKGGVGRSMAMASVAHVLAQWGLRVLAVDFDLEAPGIERYFFDSERSKAVRAQPGLIDLIQAYRRALSDQAAFASGEFTRWKSFCLTAVNVAGSRGGSVDLMTAGKREPESAKRDYALAVRSFDWQDFFYNWKGDLFFDWLRRQLRNRQTGYDAVLVDSRTGVTEMGGVCAYQLADVVVLLCAPNFQNLDGTVDVVRDFRSESVRALRRGRPLEILAIPARLDPNHPGRAAFLESFQRELGVDGLPATLAKVGLTYEKLAIPYVPKYAIAEQQVGEMQRETDAAAGSKAFERLADVLALLSDPDTSLGQHRNAALQRLQGVEVQPAADLVADVTRSSAGYDAFIDYGHADESLVHELVQLLEASGFRTFLDQAAETAGESWKAAAEQALAYSSVLVVCFGQPTDTEWRANIIASARRVGAIHIIPVMLPGSDEKALASFDLSASQAVDIREWHDTDRRDQLVRAVRAAALGNLARTQAHLTHGRDPYPGARAFTEDDAACFFGRERQEQLLLEGLANSDVLLLTGAAQVGKTSLVQAGLLPCLRQQSGNGSAHFDAVAYYDVAGSGSGTHPQWGPTEGSALLVLDGVDSFPADGIAGVRESRWREIASLIPESGARRKLVIVGRDSVVGREVPAVRQLLEERKAVTIELGPLDRAALSSAIEEPARRAAGHLLEPGLAERLMESAGGSPSAIARIQLALFTIWPDRTRGWLTNKNLDSHGHLEGIVLKRHQTILQALPPAELAAARVLFSRLVTLSSSYSPVSSPQSWDVVATMPVLGQIDAVALRDRLAGAGIVDLYNVGTSDIQRGQSGELQVALASRNPAPYLSLDGAPLDLRFLLWRGPLSIQASRWEAGDTDTLLRGSALEEALDWFRQRENELTRAEHEFIHASEGAHIQQTAALEQWERERLEAAEKLAAERGAYAARLQRGRRLLLGMLAASVLFLIIALFQTFRERRQTLVAEQKVRLAMLALQNAKSSLEVSEDYAQAAQAAVRASTESARAQAISKVQTLDRRLSTLRTDVANLQCPDGRQLYLHVGQRFEKPAAQALIPSLQGLDFTVPGVELVDGVPRVSQVRYFRPGDLTTAKEAVAALQKSGIAAPIDAVYIAGYANSAKPCQYEAWFAEGVLAGKPRS